MNATHAKPKPKPPAPSGQGLVIWSLVAAALAPSLLGLLAPDAWWGSHWLAFLPRSWAALTALLALAAALLAARLASSGRAEPSWLARRPWLSALAVAAAFAAICHFLGMATDIYGDARRNLAHLEQLLERGNPGAWRSLLSLDLLHRETGERLVLNLVWLLARALGCSARIAFDLFNAGWGFVFAFAWTLAVLTRLRTSALRWLLLPVGLLSGAAPLFTDHAEIYGPAVTLALLFLLAMGPALERRERRWLALLALLFLLAAKAHFANLILAVPLILALADIWPRRERAWITRRRLLAFALAPLALVFLVLYFGVMQNHAVSRFVDDLGRSRLFFLPLVNAETNGAPVYTLFSFWHLFDYLNLALLWSTPALLLIAGTWLLRRRFLSATPSLILAELSLFLYAAIFFVTNPVLGMPRDWDLFALPTSALLVYALSLAAALTAAPTPTAPRPAAAALPRPLLGAAFTLLVLGLPVFAVNQRPALSAARLESIGVHSYRSYWKGAIYLLNVAAELDGERRARAARAQLRENPPLRARRRPRAGGPRLAAEQALSRAEGLRARAALCAGRRARQPRQRPLPV